MAEVEDDGAASGSLVLVADAGLSDPDRLDAALDRIGDRASVAALVLEASAQALDLVRPLRAACHARGFACLIDADTAEDADGADGAVVEPAPRLIEALRRRLGADAIIGARCGLSRHEAIVAGEAGADFVGFEGRAGDDDALLEIVSWWTDLTLVPCMIAGPGPIDRRRAFIDAGAAFLAVPPALWLAPEAGPALDRFLDG